MRGLTKTHLKTRPWASDSFDCGCLRMGNSTSNSIPQELFDCLIRRQQLGADRLQSILAWRSHDGSVFHELASNRSELLDALEFLLSMSRDSDELPASINHKRHSDGATPLIVAAAMGAERAVAVLLAHGANPFLADKTPARRTALHWAVLKCYPSLIEPLVKASETYLSSSREESSGNGWMDRKRHGFLAEQHSECIPLVDLQTRSAFTPLHYAAWGNNWKCARVLIRMGASIHERRRDQWRALIGFTSPSRDQTLGSECPNLCTALHLSALRGAYRTARTILSEHLMIITSESTWLSGGFRLSREPLVLRQYDPRLMVDASRATPYHKLGQSSLISLRRNRPLML